ncbi:MAG: hypothetical protein ACYTKC_15500 [Planctomycetota bacterium]
MEPSDRLSELLDGEPAVQEPMLREPMPQEPAAGVPTSELAEHLFVSGALKHLLAEDASHLDRQIGRAMATIDAMAARRGNIRRWLTWSLSAAAVLLIALVVALQRPESLMATVDRVIDAAQDGDVDREFEVRLRLDEDASLDDLPPAHVCSRGSDKFVAKGEFPLFGESAFGTDGKEFWLVPSEPAPVMTFTDKALMEEFTQRMGLTTQRLQLANTVRRLRTHYDVVLTKDSTEPAELIDFTGRRHKGAPDWLPEYLRVVAHRRTGKPHKLVYSWGPDRPRFAPVNMIFKLVSEEPKPDSFYGHADHHDPNRIVQRFGR